MFKKLSLILGALILSTSLVFADNSYIQNSGLTSLYPTAGQTGHYSAVDEYGRQIIVGTISTSGLATEAKQDTQITSLQLLDDAISTTGSAVPAKSCQASGTDGTNARVLKTDSAGELQADILSFPDNEPINVAQMNGVAVTMGNGASGTGVQRVTLASDSTGNIATIGTSVTPGTSAAHLGKAEDAAHASGDTGVALLTRRITSNATSAGASADYATLDSDDDGRVYVNPFGASVDKFFTAVSASDITNTTSTSVKAAVASNRHYITSLSISNMHASVNTRVDVLDGATVIWQCAAAANGGGCTHTFPTPLRGSVNTAINCQNATTGAATRCAISGYTSTN